MPGSFRPRSNVGADGGVVNAQVCTWFSIRRANARLLASVSHSATAKVCCWWSRLLWFITTGEDPGIDLETLGAPDEIGEMGQTIPTFATGMSMVTLNSMIVPVRSTAPAKMGVAVHRPSHI
jgi:hypothetical protein